VNCTFISADIGIVDIETGGNHYANDSFFDIATDISVLNSEGTVKEFNYDGVED
jgi:hypothetical protein